MVVWSVACIGTAAAAHLAYREWARRRARRAAADGDGGSGDDTTAGMPQPAAASSASGVRAWLRSGRAAPWHWERTALHALAGAAMGLAVALMLPLPQTGLQAS